MKIKTNIILLSAMLGLLTACRDDVTPPYSVGEADNAITLRAGIREGGEGVAAVPARNGVRRIASGAEDNHTTPGHVNFTNGTQLRLRVDGTWHSATVTKTTTGTTGAKTGNGELHNVVSFSTTSSPVEQLYWDDYGTADPDNTAGRTEGLTIYGAAVDGVTTAPAISSWTAQSWNVGEPSTGVIDQTGGWAAKDLLTSNNIRVAPGDGTYKFDDYVYDLTNDPDRSSNLLEFTHAMSKITVNLTAGEGFPGFETGAANAKFQTAPTVKLLGFNYTGTVNVETKTSTATDATTTDINMHLAVGGASNNKAKFDALVFPGNTFTATIADDANKTPTSATNILELNADGNIYKVTAAQLVKAIAGTSTTGTPVDGTLEQGKNYILNIIVNKTKIVVTATIKNWEDVETENALPKINVTATYGYTTAQGGTGVSDFTKDYDLFRSTTKANGYDDDNETAGINPAARFSSSAWDKTIFWPDHQTHYFFRGVYPQVGTTVSGTSAIGAEAVTTVRSNDVIAVANATYTTATYPSDLAIAIPRKADGSYDETCKETGHTAQEGICATEGVINMNFQYVMSQVEVELQSVTGTPAVHIDENTIVELVNLYNSGEVKLSDGSVGVSGGKGNYTLDVVTGTGNELKRHSAIVPQTLTFTEKGATTNLRFKITVTNDDAVMYANAAEYNAAKGTSLDDAAFAALSVAEKTKTPATTDVYYADVEPILKSDKSGKVAPNGKWESGVHYKYILTLSKTAVNVTATIKDWVTVTANDNVWF